LKNRIAIFANPIAGRGKGKTLANQLQRDLIAAGYEVELFFDRPSDLSHASSSEPKEAAISIGGDGTLRSVVNYYFANRIDGPPVLPVPMGTANLMGRHLGIQWQQREIIPSVLASIRRRKVVQLDAGLANGRIFLLMAGVGVDAQIVHLLDQMRSGPIDMTSYLLPAAMTFARYSFPAITVSVDGQFVLQEKPAIAMISNVKEYGIGFPILPNAVPDDGLLDLCLMPCQDRRQLIEILVHIAAGEHITRDDVINLRGKSINIDAKQPVPVQVDGDSAGFTPLKIELLPGRIPFIVPV
jgi:YegS/Rv2252/BmrU family lipid kinase